MYSVNSPPAHIHAAAKSAFNTSMIDSFIL